MILFCFFRASLLQYFESDYHHLPAGLPADLAHRSGCHKAPKSVACALNTLRFIGIWHLSLILASTSRTPQIAMLLLSAVAVSVSVDTHQMLSSNGKQLKCGQTYDKLTPPIPSTCAMIRRKKSVPFLRISCAMPKRPISSIATFS